MVGEQASEGRGITPLERPRGIPPLADVLAAMRVVAIPTRTRFRGVAVREAAIFEAPLGASEFSPFPEYGDEEAASWLEAALDFGWHEQPPPLRDRIEVNATVPAVPAEEVRGILARFPGCRTAKVKVAERGQSLADDVARVREVREAMGPDARVRVDANGGWTVDEAVTALRALSGFDLDYAEQPCATVSELAELRARLSVPGPTPDQKAGGSNSVKPATGDSRKASAEGSARAGRDDGVAGSYRRLAETDGATAIRGSAGRSPIVRIAADESVRRAADPLAVARAGAADLLVIKAQPLGGIRRALDIVERAGLPVVVSSALDTSVGISMGLHLAAALPDRLLAGACGLGTVALLDGDVTARSLLPERGEIPVERPALAPDLLDRYAAPPERERWWRERVTRCHALLAERTRRA